MKIYVYILVMALVTYSIRLMPLTLIRRKIENPFIRSFFYYMPYATLAAMTFPAILYAGNNRLASLAGFGTALFLAFRGRSLLIVAGGATLACFLASLP